MVVEKERIYLLDTNVIIDFFRGNALTKKRILKFQSLNISSIVYGELIYGIENASHKDRHKKQLDNFIKSCLIIPVTKETSKIYGKLKTELKKQGRLIPENDIWIAAQTIEQDAILLSNDKHFEMIKDLKSEKIN